MLRYRLDGRQHELTLGRYPDLSLSDARRLAAEKRVQVQQGTHVAREKRLDRQASVATWTVRQLAADYTAKVLPTLAENSVTQRRRYLEKRIVPRLGALAVREVTGADLVDLLERCPSRPTADALLSTARALFAHACARKIVAANPAAGINAGAVLGGHAVRERLMLTDAELAVLLPALDSLDERYALAVRVLLVSAARVGELVRAQWTAIDLDAGLWTIPPEHSKTGSGFVVPLPGMAADAIRRLHVLAHGSEYVLPAMRRRKAGVGHIAQHALNAALHRLCDDLDGLVRRFTPHDLRSTARSHLAELGVSVVVAERCLNHRIGGLVQVYDRHDYIEERRQALNLWAAKLASLETAGTNKVVALRTR